MADEDTPEPPTGDASEAGPTAGTATAGTATAGAATLLPATAPVRAGRSRLIVIVVVVVIVVLAGVAALVSTLGGSKGTDAPVAARVENKVPKSAVFASSNTAAADTAGVVKAAETLLAGKLPAAVLSSAVRNALVHPPAAGTSAPMLGAALALDDPQLPSCISSVTGGDTLFGIDRISYAGAPSLLIVTADNDSGSDAFAYVIGAGCALPGTGIRTVVTVPLQG